MFRTTEKDERLEETLTGVLEKALGCVKMEVSGRIVRKENGGAIITIENEDGRVLVDINDGITNTDDFFISDLINHLPLQGAYLNLEDEKLIFIFNAPQ